MPKLIEKIKSTGSKIRELAPGFIVSQKSRYGMHNWLVVIMAICFIILVYVLASRHHYRIDFTENKEYSLSPQTIEVLQSQEEELELIAFFNDMDGAKSMVAELLEEFSYYTDKLKYRFVDADLMRSEAIKYGVKDSRYGTVVIQSGDKRTDVLRRDIISTRYSGRQPSQEFSGEQAIISAIAKMRKEQTTKLYFLVGHGEKVIGGRALDGLSTLMESLERESYQVEEINLLSREQVPEDCGVLVVPGPQKNIGSDEWQKMEKYLAGGGAMLYLLENQVPAGQKRFFKQLGLEIMNGIVVEPGAGYSVARDFRVILPEFAYHQITQKLMDTRQAVLLPQAVPLKYDNDQDIYYGGTLLQSSSKSWAELDLPLKRILGDNTFDEKRESIGGHQVAVALWRKKPRGHSHEEFIESRIVVVGDSDLASNYLLEIAGNSDFILNSLAWLAGEEEGITVRPRDIRKHPVFMTGGQSKFIAYFVYLFFPLLILVAGGVVWWKRKSL